MADTLIYEGTLDEIVARYGKELAGRRVKVTVETSEPTAEAAPQRPFYETATPEEWSRALHEWGDSHNSDTPLLSDEAISRDSIYEGRG